MAPHELQVIGLHQLGRDGSLPDDARYGYAEQYQYLLGQIDTGQQYFVFGASMGATFATQMARENAFVKGLIIGDYIPRYYKLGTNWVGQIQGLESICMSPDMVEAIARDSEDISFDQTFRETTCPILLLKGEKSSLQPDKLPSNTHLQVQTVPNAGHDIFEPDAAKAWELVIGFIKGVSLNH